MEGESKMKKIAMLVLLMLFGLMNAASASVQNSEDDCGYYKTVYFSPIGTTNRTVSANLNMYHKTLEKEWSLGLGTQYYDTDEVYGYVNFLAQSFFLWDSRSVIGQCRLMSMSFKKKYSSS